MSLRFRWSTLGALPKQVSAADYLLALHLGLARGMTWHCITKRYPRSLTEMISDRGQLWWTRYSRWRKATPRRAIVYSAKWVTLAILLWAIFLSLLIGTTPDLTMLMKTGDNVVSLFWGEGAR